MGSDNHTNSATWKRLWQLIGIQIFAPMFEWLIQTSACSNISIVWMSMFEQVACKRNSKIGSPYSLKGQCLNMLMFEKVACIKRSNIGMFKHQQPSFERGLLKSRYDYTLPKNVFTIISWSFFRKFTSVSQLLGNCETLRKKYLR